MLNKRDELETWVAEHAPVMTALAETWLYQVSDAEIPLVGYSMFRTQSVVRSEGGAGRVLTVGPVYRAPSDNVQNILHSIRRWTTGGRCLLLGDFNAPNIDWKAAVCGYREGTFERQLHELLEFLSFYQHLRDPTRFQGSSASGLDLVISPRRLDVVDMVRLIPSDQQRPNVWKMQNEELRAAAQSAQWPVPHLFVDGKHIGGEVEIKRLHESGQLKTIIEQAGQREVPLQKPEFSS
ncbi:unnamed protein product [Echinostoma caproni]|uniref:Glutaredoxin domain-containing protein n=1 Tax=Echinostoma caproni TaxID=27848 RepID=A0A183B948_9TREM|nr:unnamed protein product [Echinostoma caproni]